MPGQDAAGGGAGPEAGGAPAATPPELEELRPPPAPAGYTLREEATTALLAAVLEPGAGATALVGAAGAGKSVLAAALLREQAEALGRRFPDGVFWLELGGATPAVVLQSALLRRLRPPQGAGRDGEADGEAEEDGGWL